MANSKTAGSKNSAATSSVAVASTDAPLPTDAPPAANKLRRKKRSGKKRKNRRQSFIAAEDSSAVDSDRPGGQADRPAVTNPRTSFYRLGRGNKSTESLESEALLDHRESVPMQTRRPSLHQSLWGNSSQSRFGLGRLGRNASTSRLSRAGTSLTPQDAEQADDNTPLLSSSFWREGLSRTNGYGTGHSPSIAARLAGVLRRSSPGSSISSPRPSAEFQRNVSRDHLDDYDVNNPPSVPGSPILEATRDFEGSFMGQDTGDTIIDVDRTQDEDTGVPGTPIGPGHLKRRMTMAAAEEDVCFPQDILSEIAEEDDKRELGRESTRSQRRRRKKWPDLEFLEEWRQEEKEQSTFEEVRARKVNEPLLVEGRLRPRKVEWHREIEEVPYRFTYFNEEFESTIHAQTISELVQPGQTFEDLFIPKPTIITDSSSDEEEGFSGQSTLQNIDYDRKISMNSTGHSSLFRADALRSPAAKSQTSNPYASDQSTGQVTPRGPTSPPNGKMQRFGPRPIFWLDVCQPTEAEMRVLSKAFAIHPLTTEDIMTQEAREKVELFRNYYLVSYRSFEQDVNREDYLEPVNMYVVVFREGILSFHFSQTPHPANVRRRIRQLSDYLFLTTDWISYALIDDITDAYAPLIHSIEEEVDHIDELILDMHSNGDDEISLRKSSDILRYVGQCRKKVMGLYRLLGTKADVIKGFAKKCNEQWEVAPRSEIGLYLGDIQDHIVTMTGNLSHYESLLSRAHSNYLTQINLRMNERAERTNDVLGKLTVLGTIVLPMNIVTGLFGMNTRVPGEQGKEGDMTWFWSITGGLLICGFICFFIARRSFGVV